MGMSSSPLAISPKGKNMAKVTTIQMNGHEMFSVTAEAMLIITESLDGKYGRWFDGRCVAFRAISNHFNKNLSTLYRKK